MTRLVTVAHGTRHPAGNVIAREITAAAGRLLGVAAVATYVELGAPLLTDELASSCAPAVVVPLLLSTGHHVREDLPAALGSAAGPVTLGAPLGPDPLLARAQVARLVEAGAEPGQPVVLVAAGSRDPRAAVDLARAARRLSFAWAGPVTVATLSGHGPRPADVVTPATAVSPYLLAPGHFADRARAEALAAGAVACADVMGAHPLVVDLVVARATALMAPHLAA